MIETLDAKTQESPDAGAEGRACVGLALMPEKTILDEARLADLLGVAQRTIRRMVARFELPRPVRFGGRASWMAGDVLRHFETRALAEAQAARRERERLLRLTP